ncbi:hypothetical protein GC176_26940 [bacterium]|nr:hypothetical protein [bacterium]
MPEPTMIGGLALGVLGSYLANRVDDAQRPLVELIKSRLKRGAELLHQSGADHAGGSLLAPDDPLLLDAAKKVRGHALTLQLLGGYLRQAHGGDIRRTDRIDFTKAFQRQLEGHAYNVMEAYERWFEGHGVEGQRQLAVLRLTGLFDRSADAGCLQALR